ncbi:MAG: hypothetical protein IJP63_09195 [Acholeplasmatales bacterium]|nr:hypothetical protein [Acholeplasmatales bacterium]
MEFINGKSNAGSDITRGGRWYGLGLTLSQASELTAKLQKQVTTDKTAIRFVATLEGLDSTKLKDITSLKYTIKVTGYKAFDKEVDKVYTSVKNGSTTICAAKDNTYYCSYLFTNLLDNDGALVGSNITAYLTIVIGNTTIKTNNVGYIVVSA